MWLAYVRRIHRWPVNSPHKGPVTRKMFPFDDIIIKPPTQTLSWWVKLSKAYILSAKLLPPRYNDFSWDTNAKGSGAMVMIMDFYVPGEVETSECSSEVLWVKIQLKGEIPCMSPQCIDSHQTILMISLKQLDHFTKKTDLALQSPSSVTFNPRGVDWQNLNAPL